jgi:proton-dependent oligopeptide transporter, POT family
VKSPGPREITLTDTPAGVIIRRRFVPLRPPEGRTAMASGYRTTPENIATMPPGIPYIVGNEAAERFSFYGMKTILTVYVTTYLMNSSGQLAVMGEAEANIYFHLFEFAAYAFPILGAIVADAYWGKYRTIMILSTVYCLGHLALAIDETRVGLTTGLILIAIGTGGIKPCVSAHVGDQFGSKNGHLIKRVYGWFYFAINFGSFFSTLLTPAILHRKGVFAEWIPASHSSASYAFGLPGVLMAIATLVFWLGRNRYAHIPPAGKQFFRDTFGEQGRETLRRLWPLYFFILFFWTLYDQTGSSWVQQGKQLDCTLFGIEFSRDQIQAVNPLLVMLYIPLFNYVLYPWLEKRFRVTPLRKIGIGFALTAAAFAISWWIEIRIETEKAEYLANASFWNAGAFHLRDVAGLAGEGHPSAWWQILAYVVITAGEIMVSITGLEYSYTQAPNKMKSLVMSFYLLTVSLGNVLTVGVNALIQDENGNKTITDTTYFAIFTCLMIVVTAAYAAISPRFREKTYVQGTVD